MAKARGASNRWRIRWSLRTCGLAVIAFILCRAVAGRPRVDQPQRRLALPAIAREIAEGVELAAQIALALRPAPAEEAQAAPGRAARSGREVIGAEAPEPALDAQAIDARQGLRVALAVRLEAVELAQERGADLPDFQLQLVLVPPPPDGGAEFDGGLHPVGAQR